ncbi:uncharacterized protein LOC117194514 [Drosophila miranda]|uniref:uncharacterized protein LOC117194514 n=1 Tax=Drosophila miranda TaxID=7229 RepID=UPI00143FAB26|nr:uncharacterized protein LOC117194514 [Drosophila miranda]
MRNPKKSHAISPQVEKRKSCGKPIGCVGSSPAATGASSRDLPSVVVVPEASSIYRYDEGRRNSVTRAKTRDLFTDTDRDRRHAKVNSSTATLSEACICICGCGKGTAATLYLLP